jgi:hypothetical protein
VTRAEFDQAQHERRTTTLDVLHLLDDLSAEPYLDRVRYYSSAVRALAHSRGPLAGDERMRIEAARRVFRVPLRVIQADVERYRAEARRGGRRRLRVVRGSRATSS